VEDDVAVREFTAAVLKDYGYRVLQANTAADALEVWKWHGARIKLLLTDLVLQDRVTGLDLANKLRGEKNALRVIVMSGQTHEVLERTAARAGDHCFLPKPCRPQALARAVRAALDLKS
jgi:DNA-binding NtrC family response regulator